MAGLGSGICACTLCAIVSSKEGLNTEGAWRVSIRRFWTSLNILSSCCFFLPNDHLRSVQFLDLFYRLLAVPRLTLSYPPEHPVPSFHSDLMGDLYPALCRDGPRARLDSCFQAARVVVRLGRELHPHVIGELLLSCLVRVELDFEHL